jgi:hypothetical protein
MIERKVMKPDEFRDIARRSSQRLSGYVSLPADPHADYILYGLLPFVCPELMIPDSLLNAVELGDEHPCNNGAGVMWEARVVFNDSVPQALIGLLRHLTMLAGRSQRETCRERDANRDA